MWKHPGLLSQIIYFMIPELRTFYKEAHLSKSILQQIDRKTTAAYLINCSCDSWTYWLTQMSQKLTLLRQLALDKSPINDAMLHALTTSSLRYLSLSIATWDSDASYVSDSGIDTIIKINSLEHIFINDPQADKITDVGFNKLLGLPNLVSLSLSNIINNSYGQQITNGSAVCPKLNKLSLSRSSIMQITIDSTSSFTIGCSHSISRNYTSHLITYGNPTSQPFARSNQLPISPSVSSHPT